ncbi:MAG: hypothetical protein ACP5E3_01820 [Bacteroidales bacterium]
MPKLVMIGLVFFLGIFSVNAQTKDSARIEELIQNTENEINSLDNKYRRLENKLRELNEEISLRLKILNETDSLQLLAYKDLLSENESLKESIEVTRDSLNNGIQILQQELYEARKGNATLLIVLFSLIVISFIYLFYRNYRLEVQVNEKFLKASMDAEQKIQKLKNNFRKKLAKFADSIDKKIRKRIKKSDKSFNKKLRKNKK